LTWRPRPETLGSWSILQVGKGVEYQPYIITYDDKELPQLCYDTREEAQARVDEINTEDRLDKLGVEGKQNKKVDIREDKRTHTETISKGEIEKFAKKLAVKDLARYKPDGKKTHCSEFMRDFARELLGRDIPELRGKAGEQFDQLKAAAASTDSKWRSLSFSRTTRQPPSRTPRIWQTMGSWW
jgi:hypothetical protein